MIKIGENPILLDNSKEDRKIDPKKFLEYVSPQIVDDKMYYLLLDEVQKLGAFESVLNGFLRKKNMDVYVTGSNSKFLSKDILTEFEGRGDEIHVLPLSFSEFFSIYDGSKEEAFDDYSVYGGLPAVALMRAEEQKVNYLVTQINNLYLKDIINRYHLQSAAAIGELLDVIATFASVKQTTISELTVDKYIGHMEDAFMINRVKRYDVKGRKYIGTPYITNFDFVDIKLMLAW